MAEAYVSTVWSRRSVVLFVLFGKQRYESNAKLYTVCPQKTPPPFIFPITLSKINRFRFFLVCEFLRQFDINNLYICPPYLYTITTLPWEIQNSHFSTVLFIQTSDYYVISEETNCNCCTAAYLLYFVLFTASCYLLSPILWSVFFISVRTLPACAR